MKILLSNFAAFLALWIISPCYCQNKLFDKVWTDIKKVKTLSKDPIMVIGPQKRHEISRITINSNANNIEWECYYLLYRQSNKNYIVKYVELMEKYNGKKIYKSKSLDFVNDTLFEWLNSQKNNITKEEILPFIYIDSMLNVPVYKQGFRRHTFPFGISVHFQADSSMTNLASFNFDEIALQPVLMTDIIGVPQNLNFEYNRQLTIFGLYNLLKKMLADYKDKFKFT